MTRRRPDALLLVLALVASSMAAAPAPRSDSQPGARPGMPTAADRPEGRSLQPAASGNGAASRSGAPDPKASERPGPVAVTSLGPRVHRDVLPDPRSGAPIQAGLNMSPQPAAVSKPRPSSLNTPRPTKPPVTAASPTPLHVTIGPRLVLEGTASWFCLRGRSVCTRGYPSGLYAAAGPAIRAALGDWRGRKVRVSTSRASVVVTLIDSCQCPNGRVLDLYASVWGGLGVPLSQGLVDVTVEVD